MAALLFKEPEQLIGCFSPAVPAYFADLWINHGGITANPPEDDCRHVNFFFCAGLKDPWLHKLACRPLTVVHPEWIKAAILQNFAYLEISAYVLNDLVDEGEIPPFADEHVSTRLSRPGSRNFARATNATHDNKQKRRHSAIDFSFSALDRRPSKKARIQTPENDDASIYSPTISSSPSSSTSEQSVVRLIQGRHRPQMKFARLSKQYNPVELFERRITRQILPGAVRPAPARPAMCVDFWQGIKRKNVDPRSLFLAPDFLSRAPAPVSVIFDVNKSYRSKPLACVELAPK